MAECQSEKKPAAAATSSSGFDLYGGGGGLFNAKMMQQVGAAGGTTATVTTGKIDRFQGWSRYNKDNQAATAETRISSFSKEDSFTYSSIYSSHGFPREKNPQQQGMSKPDTPTRAAGQISSGTSSSSTIAGDGFACEGGRRTSSGSGVPPLGHHSATTSSKAAAAAGAGSTTTKDAGSSLSLHARSSSTEENFNKDSHGKHRRQMSDLGGSTRVDGVFFGGENFQTRRNVSGEISSSVSSSSAAAAATPPRMSGSDSSGYWSRSDSERCSSSSSKGGGAASSGSSSGGGSPGTVLNLKVSSSATADSPSPRAGSSTSSGASSRGSSLAGSPTVGGGRSGSTNVASLFGTTTTTTTKNKNNNNVNTSGASMAAESSSTGPATVRSSSSNAGNLHGAVISNGGSGGGVTKLATTANGVCQYGGVPSSPSIGIITGPASHSRVSNGVAAAAQASTTTVQAKLNPKTEGPKGVAASTVHGRGNIYAVGESLLIKRMLSSTDPEDVKNAGNDQYKKGNFSEALSLYDRAVSLAPNRASYRSNRAAALTGLGRLAEAVQECEESIKLDASYIRGHQRLVSLCIRLGRVERAKKILKVCGPQLDLGDIQRLEMIEKHLMRCSEAKKVSDWNTIVRESEAAITAGADSAPQILALKAEALLKLCRPEDAEMVITSAQKVETALRKATGMLTDTTILIVQVQIDMALGRFDDAVTTAEKAAHIDPNNREVIGMLRTARAVVSARTTGNDLYKAGRILEASLAYGQGLHAHPSNAVLLCNRAACRSVAFFCDS
jgi:tetratricopeptide (TPR) repeat protein